MHQDSMGPWMMRTPSRSRRFHGRTTPRDHRRVESADGSRRGCSRSAWQDTPKPSNASTASRGCTRRSSNGPSRSSPRLRLHRSGSADSHSSPLESSRRHKSCWASISSILDRTELLRATSRCWLTNWNEIPSPTTNWGSASLNSTREEAWVSRPYAI